MYRVVIQSEQFRMDQYSKKSLNNLIQVVLFRITQKREEEEELTFAEGFLSSRCCGVFFHLIFLTFGGWCHPSFSPRNTEAPPES